MISQKIKLLLFLPVLLIVQACGGSDTITVVPDAPRTGSSSEATARDEADFKEITIGLIEPVTNFDPLFAADLSTMRVISLIYEGLIKLNHEGEPEMAIASNVELSEDGLDYTITINREIFFHNSSAFVAGVGRRIHANDVKWAFERTAHSSVPTYASNILKNVRGYTNYFLEQRNQFDSERRVVEGITGIEVLDPETIQISLIEPDSDFLKKLASPYLFIYPQEAAERGARGLKSNPVGTGQYVFRSVDDNRIILSRNESSHRDLPAINRIDFVHKSNESELFQEFARSRIDWIPETGPQINSQILDDDSELTSTYADQYQIVRNESSRITSFYINPESHSNLSWLKNRLSELSDSDIALNGEITKYNLETLPGDVSPDEVYYIMHTHNPVARTIFSQVNSTINPESAFTFLDISVVIPETTLYSKITDSFHNNLSGNDSLWMVVETPILGLHHLYLSGIQTSIVPWHLTIESIRLRDSERQPS
jgi:ABC-type transport system substrate-binding protein